MKITIKFSLIAIMLSLANVAFADKVCLKSTIVKNKIKQKTMTIASTSACPKGTAEIINTAILVGAVGSAGATGPQGPEGGFKPTLPSGQVMKGVYGGFISATAANQFFTDAQTFPFPLPSDMIATHYLKVGDPAIAACPGTAAAPDAQAGHLCLYEASGSNRNASINIYNPATGFTTLTNWRNGFGVYSDSTGTGTMSLYGSWAVRAQ